jgi:GntR family transcriptional regulator
MTGGGGGPAAEAVTGGGAAAGAVATAGVGGRTAEDVRRTLADRISAGRLRPGQRLGAERALAAELGVSRAALRQALAVLEEGGLVRRVPGRGGGTFVSKGKIERDLSRVVGVPALLRSQGVVAGTRVLSAKLAAADETAARALRLNPGDLVIDLVRIRLADGSPFSVEHAMLPADRFPGLLEMPLGGSVYELLDERFSTRPKEAVERIEVVSASPGEAMILDVPDGAPLLSVTRTTVDSNDEPIEFSHDLFRGDRTRIVVRTPGHGGVTGASRGRGQVIELRAQAAP